MGNAYGHSMHRPDGWFSSLVSAPETPLISTADAKAWLRVTSSAEDGIVAALVAAANDYLDARDGILGRALITQRWRLTMASFPGADHIHLPVPIVRSVVAFNYYDTDNVEQAFTDFTLTIGNDDAIVTLADGASWPSVYDRVDAIQIEYDTGYGDDPSDVPQAIRTAALLMIAQWFDNRQSSADKVYSELPFGVRALLMNYRLTRGHM